MPLYEMEFVVQFVSLLWILLALTLWNCKCLMWIKCDLQTVIWTHSTTILRPFVSDYPGEPVPEEMLIIIQLSFISFLHLLWSMTSSCSIYMFNSLFAQPFSKSSLVYLLLWHPQLTYSTHFFTQSLFFLQHIPIPLHLFRCSTEINII